MVEARVEEEEQGGGEGEGFSFGEELGEDAPEEETGEPSPEDGEDLPGEGLEGDEFGEEAVPNSPCGAVGGEVAGEGFLTEFVTNPADGEVIPVEAELGRKDAVGERGD